MTTNNNAQGGGSHSLGAKVIAFDRFILAQREARAIAWRRSRGLLTWRDHAIDYRTAKARRYA